jgi:ACS family glucarate transporter-like MFS transporter
VAGVLGGLGAWAEGNRRHKAVVAEAARMSSLPQWLGVVGGLCGGMLSDYVLRRTGSRRWARNGVAIGSLLVCLGWYLAAFSVEGVGAMAVLLAMGSFFFNFSSPCAYALTIDMGGKNLAVVFGLMNMIGNLGAWLFVSSVMWMVGMGGWHLAFVVWTCLHLPALLCWLFLDSERKTA